MSVTVDDILELIHTHSNLLETEKTMSPLESAIVFCIELFQQHGALYLPIHNRKGIFLLDKYGQLYSRQNNDNSMLWWEPYKSNNNITQNIINRELIY